MKILVTGSEGFIGKNLIARLKTLENTEIYEIDKDNDKDEFRSLLLSSDLVYHLAGVNRPKSDDEFFTGNFDITKFMVNTLLEENKTTPIVFSSSTQAQRENPYGVSKRLAENTLVDYIRNGGEAYIYRLTNVFGKWCRPNYNSVVATFCHNIAHDLEIQINNPNTVLELNYVDDVVEEFLKFALNERQKVLMDSNPLEIPTKHTISLVRLAEKIYECKQISTARLLPDLKDELNKKLYSTFLSYLPYEKKVIQPELRADNRGNLFEMIKSHNSGQIFVSKTKPGIVRGNHYHHTKVEKFCVISGKAVIRLRRIDTDEIKTYEVDGEAPSIVDIPPGYTHNIENIGKQELITLFWANEVFDPEKPDTYYEEV